MTGNHESSDSDGVALDDTSPTPHERSIGRLLLWSSLDLDPTGLGASAAGVAAGVAIMGACGVLYLLGQGVGHMDFWQQLPMLAGLGVGIVGVRDVLLARPAQLVVPLAQVVAVVLVLTLIVRVVADTAAPSRAVLAWSLGLHLCLLPLSTRLWAIFFAEQATSRDAGRRRELVSAAKKEEPGALIVRVLDVEAGLSEVELIGGRGSGVLKLKTSLLEPRPKRGRVYVLDEALVINRTIPGAEDPGTWSRYLISARECLLVGDRVTDDDETSLAAASMWLQVALSAILGVIALIAAFG